MKFNWGTGIFMLYTGFALATIALVIFAMNKKVDLVTDNYYDKELKYEEQIQKEKNLGLLSEKPVVELLKDSIKINFPAVFNSDSLKGSLHFYRPSDSGKDFEMDLKPDKNNLQVVSTYKFAKGMWKLKINWFYNNQGFYTEKSLFIQ